MNIRKLTIGSALALALASPIAANAAFQGEQIKFDPDGNGSDWGTIITDNFDWGNGTGLLRDAFTTENTIVGLVNTNEDAFYLFLQASLSSLQLSGSPVFSPFNDDFEITMQLAVELDGTTADLIQNDLADVNFDVIDKTNSPSTFRIWFDSAKDSNNELAGLQGFGFGPDWSTTSSLGCDSTALNAAGAAYDGSQLILCGEVTNEDNTLSVEIGVDNTDLKKLDAASNLGQNGANDDNYNGVRDCVSDGDPLFPACNPGDDEENNWNDPTAIGTAESAGGWNFDIDVLYTDGAFFKSAVTELAVDANIDGNVQAPFQGIDPAEKVFGNTWDVGLDKGNVKPGATLSNPTPADDIRVINNLRCLDSDSQTGDMNTCSFVFEADSGTEFVTTEVIPEPGSLALIGLGLAGLGIRRKVKRRG